MKLYVSNYLSNSISIIDCDTLTLEREIFKDNGYNKNNFIVCCAALGKNSYTQFFKPLCLIDFHDKVIPNELPKNISNDDIDIDLINKLMNVEL